MGFSPLADMSRRIADGGRSNVRKSKIRGFTIHHNAGVNSWNEAWNPSRQVSAHYWIANDGSIIPNIDENRRAWTTGSSSYPAGTQSDHRNITVEVSNSPEGVRKGTWAISDAAMKSLINLIGDVFKRHNLGPVKRGKYDGVAVHQDFVPTACPGPYIMRNLNWIIAEAEKVRRSGKTSSKPSSKSSPKPSAKAPSKKGGKSVKKLADEVMAGKHGNGDARRKSLGSNYAAVQAEINRRLGAKGRSSRGKARRVRRKSNAQIAREIVYGVKGKNPWGNDPQRSKALRAAGYDPKAVQREVNKLL